MVKIIRSQESKIIPKNTDRASMYSKTWLILWLTTNKAQVSEMESLANSCKGNKETRNLCSLNLKTNLSKSNGSTSLLATLGL